MDLEALELALALHAAPGRIDELRTQPLPARGMTMLLRVALGQTEAVSEAAAAFPMDRARLVEAARFYVEQQLLARECEDDPWRVLGTHPGAPTEMLREHHHLLMRLVHPDRSDDWASAYADRVHRAWRRLRAGQARSETVRASSATPSPSEDPWEGRPAIRRIAPIPVPVPSPSPSRQPAHLVGFVGAIALSLVATAVWLRLQLDPETSAAQIASPITVPEEPQIAIRPPQPDPAPTIAVPELVPIATLNTTITQPSEAMAATPARKLEPKPTPTKATLSKQRVAIAAPTSQNPSASVRHQADPAPLENVEQVAVVNDVADPSHDPSLIPVTSPSPLADSDSLPERIDGPAILRRYRELYASGNLGGLLGLYAREVHADTGRIARLAQDFAHLFAASQQRYIDFHEVRWQERDDRLIGRARYEIGYRKRSSLRKHVERGIVAIEIVRDGATARLRRFDLRAD